MAIVVALCGCGADAHMRKGDKYYALGEYHDAALQYKKAYSATAAKERATRGQRALKMADSYRRIGYAQRAVAAYNNAVRYKQDDALLHLNLAQQLLKNGNYKAAAKEFRLVLDSLPDNKLASVGLRSAETAPKLKETGSQYTVK